MDSKRKTRFKSSKTVKKSKTVKIYVELAYIDFLSHDLWFRLIQTTDMITLGRMRRVCKLFKSLSDHHIENSLQIGYVFSSMILIIFQFVGISQNIWSFRMRTELAKRTHDTHQD